MIDRFRAVDGTLLDPISLLFKAGRRVVIDESGGGVARPRLKPRQIDVLFRTVTAVASQYHSLMQRLERDRYTDANLFDLYWVDPSDIECRSPGTGREYGSVVGGDWDRTTNRVTDGLVYQSLQQRFEDGVEWEETPLFVEFRRRVENEDNSKWWSMDEYLERYRRVDEIYTSIKRDSYQSQRDVLSNGHVGDEIYKSVNDAIHPVLNEIVVDVGRDGSLFWRTRGRHRLLIAKLIEVETIPVLVWSRHKNWESLRKNGCKNKTNIGVCNSKFVNNPFGLYFDCLQPTNKITLLSALQ